MSLYSEIKTALSDLDVQIETGVFSNMPPDRYIVITPLGDEFPLHSDNVPECEVCSARLSVFSKDNYLSLVRTVTKYLLLKEFTITDRRYIGHEDDTGYHHYAIDVEKEYEWEDE